MVEAKREREKRRREKEARREERKKKKEEKIKKGEDDGGEKLLGSRKMRDIGWERRSGKVRRESEKIGARMILLVDICFWKESK